MALERRNNFWSSASKDTSFIEDVRKYPQLKQLIRYDENFNNKRKVAFESCLANIIRNNPGALYPVVSKVANSILPDIIEIFEKIKYSLKLNEEINWLHLSFYNFFIRNDDIITVYCNEKKQTNFSIDEIERFSAWIYNILSTKSEKNTYMQLLLIREYGNYFLRPFGHLTQFKNLNNGAGIQIIPEGVGKESIKLKMKSLWDKYNSLWVQPVFHSRISTQFTSRAKVTTIPGIFSSESDYDSLPIALKIFCQEVSPHLPGKNLWRVTSQSNFTLNARYNLDVPLIADQGGSIALLLIPALVLGNLNDTEFKLFNLNAMSYMISSGHHALNEFHLAWKALGIPYIMGDYSSLVSTKLINDHPDLLKLQGIFPDLLPSKINDEKNIFHHLNLLPLKANNLLKINSSKNNNYHHSLRLNTNPTAVDSHKQIVANRISSEFLKYDSNKFDAHTTSCIMSSSKKVINKALGRKAVIEVSTGHFSDEAFILWFSSKEDEDVLKNEINQLISSNGELHLERSSMDIFMVVPWELVHKFKHISISRETSKLKASF